MKKLICLVIFSVVASFFLTSCHDYETYADKKNKENTAIAAFIAGQNDTSNGLKVKVISEEQFATQGYTTNVESNEYVLFESNGIYLQIIRKGCGKPLANGETSDILCRFTEHNLLGDSIQLTNNSLYLGSIPEKMTVRNTTGTFSGSFDTSSSIMYRLYGSQSVPAGWLFPLTYINLGRPADDNDEIAKIKVVVPSAQGQSYASQNVYPCLYEITYEKGK